MTQLLVPKLSRNTNAIAFIVALLVMVVVPLSSFSATKDKQFLNRISRIEHTLFTKSHSKEKPEARIERLETAVFGQVNPKMAQPEGLNASPNTLDARVMRLEVVLRLSPYSSKQTAKSEALKPLKNHASTPSVPRATHSTANTQENTTPTASHQSYQGQKIKMIGNVPVVLAPDHQQPQAQAQYQNNQSVASSSVNTSSQMNTNTHSIPRGLSTIPPEMQQQQQQPRSTIADDTVDYPAVNDLEYRVLGRLHKNEPLEKRLDRLEISVFKMKQNGPFYSRVDNLSLMVFGPVHQAGSVASAANDQSYQPNQTAYQDNSVEDYMKQQGVQPVPQQQHSQPAYPTYPATTQTTYQPNNYQQGSQQTYQQNQQGYQTPSQSVHNAVTPDMISALGHVEQDVLNRSYSQEPVEMRLDRLEQKVFNSTSPELAPDERLERIIAVAAAGGTSGGSATASSSGNSSPSPRTSRSSGASFSMQLVPILLRIIPMLL